MAAGPGPAVGLRRAGDGAAMSAVKEFLVPDLGEGLEDATITGWNVAVGDEVELNQTLCTVETNKAEVEIPSPYAGRIVELGGAEGRDADRRLGRSFASRRRWPRPNRSPRRRAPTAQCASRFWSATAPTTTWTPAGEDPSVSARGPSRRCENWPPSLNVDLTRVTGSGPDGVITREDVLAAAGRSAPTPEMVAVRGVQAEMAHRMTLSRKQIPDAHAGVQVDCSGLLRLRDRMRDITDDESPITPFVLTLRLLTIALRHHPNLNSTWLDTTDGPQIHLHSAVHLGFGVAAPRGLLVPVVSDAHDKTTRELAAVVARLIRDARAGTLKPAELAGLHVHGVQLRRAGVGRRRAGDQLPGGGHPRHGLTEAAPGRRRRRSGCAADDVTDVCLRPSHRRRRCRWRRSCANCATSSRRRSWRCSTCRSPALRGRQSPGELR